MARIAQDGVGGDDVGVALGGTLLGARGRIVGGREPLVRLLDVLLFGVPVNLQDRVIVSLVCHRLVLSLQSPEMLATRVRNIVDGDGCGAIVTGGRLKKGEGGVGEREVERRT
jgi:hypothetical protein